MKLYYLLLFFPLLAFNFVSAATVDNFDTYSDGACAGCGDWIVAAGCNDFEVDIAQNYNAPNSFLGTTTNSSVWKEIATTSYAVYNAYFYASAAPSGWTHFDISEKDGGYAAYIGISITNKIVINHISTTTEIAATFTTDTWHKLSIEFDSLNGYVRGRIDDTTAGWFQIPIDPAWTYITRIGFFQNYIGSNVWWDQVETDDCTETCTGCSTYTTCLSMAPVCYFNFPAASCLPAVTDYTCAADWFLQFCETEETCEAQGGYWQGGLCNAWPLDVVITTWAQYYVANSEYATATAFVQSIASTTGPFYSFVRGLSLNFGSIFNASSAIAYGSSTGAVIPTLRGYMGLVNGFFADLPIAELFLFSLFLLFASIIWQVIKGLIGLIKP